MNESMGLLRRVVLVLVSLAFGSLPLWFAPEALAAPKTHGTAAKPVPVASAAQPAPAASNGAEEGPSGSAEHDAPSVWKVGPTTLDLGHDVKLDLPSGYRFLPKEYATKVLERNGNYHNDNLLGLIAASSESDDWFVVVTFDEEGYIKDDEKIDADALLSGMRDGTKEMNEERQQHGFKPLTVEGWSDPPRYDQVKHELVWALVVSDPDGKSVNYNTRVLGRHGYVSLDLVTDPDKLAAHRSDANALLAGTGFAGCARYQDFDSKKDKVAEYGLAGLIMAGAGLGAAKLIKIGLIAKFWKVILAAIIAGKKAVAAAVFALVAYLKRLFGKKKQPETAGPQP